MGRTILTDTSEDTNVKQFSWAKRTTSPSVFLNLNLKEPELEGARHMNITRNKVRESLANCRVLRKMSHCCHHPLVCHRNRMSQDV